MNKLFSFIRLDFITVKPYLTIKTLPVYGLVVIFMAAMSGSTVSGISFGMVIGTMFSGFPFAVGERSNLDSLYITLSVGRKMVVAGRYLYALLINICAIAFAFVMSTVGLTAARMANINITATELTATEMFWIVLVLAAVFIIVQAVQLPIYFKVGYAKAQFINIIPFVLIGIGYFVILNFYGKDSGSGAAINDALSAFFSSKVWGLAILAVLAILVFISYRLSAAFYNKREF